MTAPEDASSTSGVVAEQRDAVDREPAGSDEHRSVEPASPAVDDGPVPSDGHGRAGRRRPVLIAALAAVAVALLALAAFLGYEVRSHKLDDQARQDAVTAARQSALNITSIGTQDFAADVAHVLDGSTGQFRQDFAGRTGELEGLLKDNQVSAEGRILDAAVVRSDRNSATVLVVVDSTVKNKAVPDGRVNSYRMRLQLDKVKDRWLTSALDFVS